MNDRIFRGSSSATTKVIFKVSLRIAKWALSKKEFSIFSLNDILHNWKACMGCGPFKVRRIVAWSPPSFGVYKLNVDGASRARRELGEFYGIGKERC